MVQLLWSVEVVDIGVFVDADWRWLSTSGRHGEP